MKKFKSVMALLAVVLIVAAVIAFFVSAVTGDVHFMGYLYIAWIIPVLLWIFARIADILGKYGPGAKDSYLVEGIDVKRASHSLTRQEQGEESSLYQVRLKHKKTGRERVLEVSGQNLFEEGIAEGDIVKETGNVLLKIAATKQG